MADQKVVRTIVGYFYDKASGDQVVQGTIAIKSELSGVVDVFKQIPTVSTPASQKLRSDFENLKPRIAAARADINEMRQELVGYADNVDVADRKTTAWDGDLTKLRNSIKGVRDASNAGVGDIGGGGGGGRVSSGDAIRLAGSQLRSLPSIQIPGLGIGTDSVANVIRLAGALNDVAQAVPGVTAATTLLTPAIGATAASLAAMLIPVAAVAVAIAPLLIALKILADREQAAAESAKQLADAYAKEADAFAVGQRALQDRNEDTKKEAVDLFNTLNESFRTNAEKIRFLNDKKAQSDEKTAAEIQKTIDETITEQIKLSGSIDILRGNLQQLSVQIDGTAPGLSKVGDGTNNFFTNIVSKITGFAQQAEAKVSPVLERLKQVNEEANKRAEAQVKIVDKLNKDLASLDQKAADDRKTIAVRLADTLIGINEKAIEDAEKIASDLDKQQAASRLKLQRDQENAEEKKNYDNLTRIINFNRDEIAARKKIDTELRRIREDAAAQEFEDGLSRNFSQIAANRRNLQRTLQRTTEDAQTESNARLENFKNKNDDAARQYQFEAEQRQQAYKQQNDDAIKAANEALRENEANRIKARALAQNQATQDYIALQNKLLQERNLKIQFATDDLKITTQTEAAKQQAFLSSYQQAQNLLKGITAYAGGPTPANLGGSVNGKAPSVLFKANGGNLNFGQSAVVNEYGSSGAESFTNRYGQNFTFPGMGIWTPLTSGTVNANRGGDGASINLSMPINVQGVNADAVLAKAGQMADDRIAYAIRLMNKRTA